MAKPPGLVQRGRIWQLRKRVPQDLVPRYGRAEIPVSLGTDDYRTALGLFYIEMAKLEAEFAEIRRRRDVFAAVASADISPDVLNLSEEEGIAIARALVVERIANLQEDERRQSHGLPPSDEAISDVREEISGDIGELRDPKSLAADQRVYLTAMKSLRQNGYDVSDRQRLDAGFLRLVRRALEASGRIELARLNGDYTDNPHDTLFAALTEDDLLGVAGARKPKVSLASAIDMFWDRVISLEPKAAKTEATLKDAQDRGQVPENICEAIQGWSRSMKTSRSYGDGMKADTLKPWIEKLVLPKIDLSHIVAPSGLQC